MAEPWNDREKGDVDYSLVWRFIDQSPTFCLGIEAGIVYERMRRGDSPITSTTHADNEEELRNLANCLDYRAAFEELDEYWHKATFTAPARSTADNT